MPVVPPLQQEGQVGTAKEFCLEVHSIERVGNLVIVGFDLGCSEKIESATSDIAGVAGKRQSCHR